MDGICQPFEHTEELKRLRELSAEQVQAEFDANIPRELAPSSVLWDSYSSEEVTTGLRACLLLWAATSGRLVPREFQLQATISLMFGTD